MKTEKDKCNKPSEDFLCLNYRLEPPEELLKILSPRPQFSDSDLTGYNLHIKVSFRVPQGF